VEDLSNPFHIPPDLELRLAQVFYNVQLANSTGFRVEVAPDELGRLFYIVGATFDVSRTYVRAYIDNLGYPRNKI